MLLLAPMQDSVETGSVLSISWTPDATQLAGCGANGQVVFAQLVDVAAGVEWSTAYH